MCQRGVHPKGLRQWQDPLLRDGVRSQVQMPQAPIAPKGRTESGALFSPQAAVAQLQPSEGGVAGEGSGQRDDSGTDGIALKAEVLQAGGLRVDLQRLAQSRHPSLAYGIIVQLEVLQGRVGFQDMGQGNCAGIPEVIVVQDEVPQARSGSPQCLCQDRTPGGPDHVIGEIQVAQGCGVGGCEGLGEGPNTPDCAPG